MISFFTAGLMALVMAILLFAAGYMVAAQRGEMAMREMLDRFAILRGEDVHKLASLRHWLEIEAGGVSTEQAYLLIDVCTQLGINEAETQTVVGPAYLLLLDEPIVLFEDER